MSGLESGLQFLLALALVLGGLVTVHEFGHYLVAKWCGVKVLKFSIGFGPPVGFGRYRLAWRRGETEYVIAWFLLGGFVKMLGEAEGDGAAPLADRGRSLLDQPLWKKLAIVLAGPAMNLLLPVLLLAIGLFVGFQRAEPVVGTVAPDSPAAEAGLQPGDRVLAVNGEPVRRWREVESATRARPGQLLSLRFARGGVEQQAAFTPLPREGLDEFLTPSQVGFSGLQHGVLPAAILVRDATPGLPAAGAGLRQGDRIVAVAGAPVASFENFRQAIADSGGAAISLRYVRDGVESSADIAPVLRPGGDSGQPQRYIVGIAGVYSLQPGVMGVERVRNPLRSLPQAAVLSAQMTGVVFEGLWRLVSGRISRDNLGGPIEIARQSQRALQAGWEQFLALLVIISINLGVLNLLPIPILDGGQALLFGIEGIKRGRLSPRTWELANKTGLLCLLVLMSFAFWNDLSRHGSSFVSWLSELF